MLSNRLEKLLFLLCIPILLTGFWLRANQLQIYPPGISNDEAINAVDALHIAQTGNFPMYEEDEGRAEPLFRIVEAAGILAFGRTVWALRMVSVLLSIPLIATVIWITRECLHEYPGHIKLLAGLMAGITIATMAGHVTLSRTLYRAVLQLLTMSLSIGFLLRGLRRNKWRDTIFSGTFVGITLYTYTAAWFFPPAFIITGLALLILRWKTWRQWLPKMIVLGLLAVVIGLPVLYLLVTYPRTVLGRAEALSPENVDWARNLSIMLRQFLTNGDENPQYNVDALPIIPQMVTWLFYTGLLAMLVRIRKAQSWFIFALLILLSLPALLSEEISHGLRIAGEYAIVPVIIGMGTGLILWIFDKILKRPIIISLISVVLFSVFGFQNGNRTWTKYTLFFNNPGMWRLWNVHEMQLNHNEWFFRVDRQDFGAWVSGQDMPMLIPVEELNRQTTRSWLMEMYPEINTAGTGFALPENIHLVMPWSLERGDIMREAKHYALLNDGVVTLLPPLSDDSHATLLENIERGTVIAREGQIEFLGYVQAIDSGQIEFSETQITDDTLAIFGNNDIRLTGWIGAETIPVGDTLNITLEWQSNRRIGHEYINSLQLQTEDYERISGIANYILRWIYPTTTWQANQAVYDPISLNLPDELSPGAYRLTTGLFFASYPLIDVESDNRSVLDNRVTIAWLKVAQEIISVPDSANPVEVNIADLFQLKHIEFASGGEGSLLAQLHWQGLVHRPDVDSTIFVHIVNSSGEIVAQSDSRPQDGQYPTFIWDEDEIVQTNHDFNFNDFETLDNYTVRLGMYTFPGPVNLPASYQDRLLEDGLVTIGNLSDFFTE